MSRILDERRQRIGLLGEIIDPHRDLPHVGTTEQTGAPTDWPIGETRLADAAYDERLPRIATQTI